MRNKEEPRLAGEIKLEFIVLVGESGIIWNGMTSLSWWIR
jgi:hypothetical protein